MLLLSLNYFVYIFVRHNASYFTITRVREVKIFVTDSETGANHLSHNKRLHYSNCNDDDDNYCYCYYYEDCC